MGATMTERERDAAIETVERWITAFNEDWPGDEVIDELLDDEVQFLERPNVFNPTGTDRDRAAMLHGIRMGREILEWQRFEPIGHVVEDDMVVSRMRWTGMLRCDAGPYRAGTRLTAWCVAHYTLVAGRIARIEQHDCYEPPKQTAG
jgi:hypothetical protein